MKIRLAKKIMSSGNDYQVDKRIDNAMLNENWVDDANYIRDHRITKAISIFCLGFIIGLNSNN